jgi:RHS repeat-associated protein
MTRLTSASKAGGPSASFYYDGLNRQVARTETTGGVTTTTYSLWDGWNLFAEHDSAGSQTNRWSYAGNDLVRRLGAQYGTFYFYPEASGSTRYIADGSGNILERYTYDAYGAPTFYDSTGAVRNPNETAYGVDDLFTGQRWYPDLGLYDLRNRAYLASIGRFLQPDPIGSAGDPANLYRYCDNNPANWSDPSGLGNKLDGQGDGEIPEAPRIIVTAPYLPNPLDNPSVRIGPTGGPGGGGGGRPGTSGDSNEKNTDKSNKEHMPCGPGGHGGGIGLLLGANADLGVALTGATASGSFGSGAFYDSKTGFSTGGLGTGVASANFLDHVAAAPNQSVQPFALGEYVGGGASIFFTNGRSVQQLSGSFTTYTLNVGIGPFKFSGQYAFSNSVTVVSLGPPFAGDSLPGFSVTRTVTNTITTDDGCQ